MRPGGLTALAVFNFVFGGLGVLVGLAALAAHGEIKRRAGAELPSNGVYFALHALGLAAKAALIISGVGYWRRTRSSGYVVGLIYVALSLAGTIAALALNPAGFTSANLVDFVYPLITLFLLTVIFRKDFA